MAYINGKKVLFSAEIYDGTSAEHQSIFDGFDYCYGLFAGNINKSLINKITSNDFRNVTYFGCMFQYADELIECPEFNTSSGTIFENMFADCVNLTTITKLNVSNANLEETFCTSGTFDSCTSLTNITFTGVIKSSLDFRDCPLSVQSMKNIINHLYDYTNKTGANTYSILFNQICWLALEATTPPTGYNTWVDYIHDGKAWLTTP